MDVETRDNAKIGFKQIVMIILVVGSFWGFSEVVLNEVIRDIGLLPMRAAILMGMGMLAMAFLLGFSKKPHLLLFIPILTIMLKQMAVPLVGAGFPCKANSCTAVLIQGLILTGFSSLFFKSFKSKKSTKVLIGAGTGILSAAIFLPVGLRIAPCNYLLSYSHAGGFISFMANEGLYWAIFSAIFIPFGFWLGEKVKIPLTNLALKKPGFYFSYSGAYTIICWLAITYTIVATAQ